MSEPKKRGVSLEVVLINAHLVLSIWVWLQFALNWPPKNALDGFTDVAFLISCFPLPTMLSIGPREYLSVLMSVLIKSPLMMAGIAIPIHVVNAFLCGRVLAWCIRRIVRVGEMATVRVSRIAAPGRRRSVP